MRAQQGEGWRVNIGSAYHGSLYGLVFDGASRRNWPNFKVRSSCIGHIPQPAPPLGMMLMDVHQQEVTSTLCEAYTVPQMAGSLTGNTAM